MKVYKHLSEGAEQLGGVVDMRNRLTLDKDEQDTTDAHTDKVAKDDGSDEPEGKVIEGALATATVAMTEDPDFTVSDAAVEETLTELEQTQTTSETESANAEKPKSKNARSKKSRAKRTKANKHRSKA